jgi:hypothetical protein
LTPIQTKRFPSTTRAPSELHAIMKNGPNISQLQTFFFFLIFFSQAQNSTTNKEESSLSVNITSFFFSFLFFVSFFPSQNKLFVRIMDLISSTKGKEKERGEKKVEKFFCFNIFCLNLTTSK